jgi:hypothetical protein
MDGTGADGRAYPQPLTAPLGTLGPTTPKPNKSLREIVFGEDATAWGDVAKREKHRRTRDFTS